MPHHQQPKAGHHGKSTAIVTSPSCHHVAGVVGDRNQASVLTHDPSGSHAAVAVRANVPLLNIQGVMKLFNV
jgi:hypothetical protein